MRKVVILVPAIFVGLIVCGCSELLDRTDSDRRPQQNNFDAQAENICRSRGVSPEYSGKKMNGVRQWAKRRRGSEPSTNYSRDIRGAFTAAARPIRLNKIRRR